MSSFDPEQKGESVDLCCGLYMVTDSDHSINTHSGRLLRPTNRGVVIDIGTGDGRFVYHQARQNPQTFYIGIDANPRPLKAISRKALGKPAKGGVLNVLFIHARAEALPSELDGVADEVHIHFPWSGLLRAIINGKAEVLRGLRRICAPGALLEIVIGLDTQHDRSVFEALGLNTLTPECSTRARLCHQHGQISKRRGPNDLKAILDVHCSIL
jgi:ubiquinone/menaquinone biosynthesis C-methylase UbiE